MMDIDENNNAALGNKQVSKSKPKTSKGKTVEQIYQKKTQLEHILLRPDTYVGSVEKVTQPMWVYDPEQNKIVNKTITYVPGLFKIFDEIIVNAADNKQRDHRMDRIEVNIEQESGTITVWNNGNGIPVVIHKEQNIYVPELIFGHLLTGSNFDDDQKKTTGGRNGYGAKLANIFSQEFIVETADRNEGKRFKQIFRNNMTERDQPIVTSFSGTEFTSISFKPDLARFKMDRLDDDTVALLCKRAFDIAGGGIAQSGKKLRVVLNGSKIRITSFAEYLEMYDGISAPVVFEKLNPRWEVGVGISDGSMQQISFVNSICTSKGGQHVNYIADQVAQSLAKIVKKKNKGQEVKPHMIKNHLAVFVNTLIENPAFDSQTKETLTTRPAGFGSTCKLPDSFLKQLEKSSLVDAILSFAKFKQNEQLKRKGGKKAVKLVGVPKLDDANWAGTARGHECTLVLTEGDSAKALAVSGISVVGRDRFGVFPLKGKPLNVREAAHNQIMKNEEVQNIVKILGLKFGTDYTNTKSLRYGHLLIMTDQDHDGSHIKGLLVNFFHHFFPSLLQLPGFMQQFITPIVKCTKGKRTETFFTIPEYQRWKEATNDGKGWTIKYYKGLGTSSSKEAKEYFSDLNTHRLDFEWQDEAIDGDLIDMAFSKKRVNDRKTWLKEFEQGTSINYGSDAMTYENFINKELVLFSLADNMRSIPHVMDGFKPSQRKVLFACFKRKLKAEIKVAQLAGYVSEHAAYHHGEASLNSTIVGMAQNFVGSNNVNLLFPSGQFGTRLMGGKDAASPRYIFTRLEAVARLIFHPDDDPLLNFLDDDGQSIEPDHYLPVLPMVLVNGADGIGTGWSSSVPTYDPRDVIANLRRLVKCEAMEPMHPWFNGFAGELVPNAKTPGSYKVKGILEVVDDSTILISELPVRKWTQDYKVFLESLLPGGTGAGADGIIKGFKENHTDTTVAFTVNLDPTVLNRLRLEPGGLEKKFKIEGSVSTSNMTLFNKEGMIETYATPEAIMEVFYEARIQGYEDRKNYLVDKLNKEFRKLDNKVRFILAVVEGRLVVSNRRRAELLRELADEGYELFDGGAAKKKDDEEGEEGADAADADDPSDLGALARGYDYLLSMKLWSLTMEKVNALRAEREAKNAELRELEATPSFQLWLNDLDAIEEALGELDAEARRLKEAERRQIKAAGRAHQAARRPGKKAAAPAAAKGKAKKKAAWMGDSDEEEDEISDFDDEGSGSDFEGGYRAPKATTARTKIPSATSARSADKPVPANSTNKGAAATKNPRKPAPAKKKTETKKQSVPDTFEIQDDSPVEEAPMSLAERMRMRMQGGAPAGGQNKVSSSTAIDLSDSEDDIFTCSQNVARMSILSKEDEEDPKDSSTAFDFDEAEEEVKKPSSKKAAAATKKQRAAPVQRKKATQTKAATDQATGGAKKRTKKAVAKKSTAEAALASPVREAGSSSLAIFSPGIVSPQNIKKQKTTAATKKHAAKKTTAINKNKPSKKANDDMPSSSLDEETAEILEQVDSLVEETPPKPSRARRSTKKQVYYVADDSDDDEEEEEKNHDEDEDEQDEWGGDSGDDDSDFEF